MRLECIQRIKYKDYNFRKRLEELGLTILQERRMRSNRNEILKIMEFLIIVDFFQYFSTNWKFNVKTDFKKLSLQTNCFFFLLFFFFFLANRVK